MFKKVLTHLLIGVAIFLLPGLYIIHKPNYNQQIRSSYLNEEIEIQRESNGFPHIFSKSYLGSLYGLGYVHC